MSRWVWCMIAAAVLGCGGNTAKNNPAPKGEPNSEVNAKGDPATPAPPAPGDQGEAPEKPDAPPAKIQIGDPQLTAGIPGEGELTQEQIEQWVDDPRVHNNVEVMMPAGVGWGTIQWPADNPLTRAKIELGRQLYFDERLSSDSTISCASCHDPDHGYAFDTQFGIGVDGQMGDRNSPVAFNRILSADQFWDGRADSLEAQAVGPIANPIEMGNTHENAVTTVGAIPGYKTQFERIFPTGVTIDNIGRAIASFERVLVTGPSPFDYYEPVRAFEKRFADELEDLEAFKEEEPRLYQRYLDLTKASDEHPMTDSAKRGRELFFGKARCTECHAGSNFSDEKYHNLGVGMAGDNPDLGRFNVTQKDEDRGAFKTPTCRNVTQTAPYMHDGSVATLLDVVKLYNQGGHPNDHLSKKVVKLNLSEQEEQDVVAFLEALTGPLPVVERGRLPR